MCHFKGNDTIYDEFDIVERTPHKSSSRDPNVDAETYAARYLEFTDKNPTVFHAVAHFARTLEKSGFEYLNERESWQGKIHAGGKYYTTRNGSSYAAFVLGTDWDPENGAAIAGTHVDSLTAVLKPSSVRKNVEGYELLGVAPYAGALSPLWLDRDLGVGGRLVVAEKGSVRSVLVRLNHPIARIPSLAPHFGLPDTQLNLETQAVPVLGLAPEKDPEPTESERKSPVVGRHPLRLLRALAKEANVDLENVKEVELQLFDTQPAAFGGIDKEFLFAPRVDDKACSYVALYGLVEAADALAKSNTCTIVAGFDNEEVGSTSKQGAVGNLLDAVVSRMFDGDTDATRRLFYANSFLVSADVTHAVNPNFAEVYLDGHKPKLNVGLTLAHEQNNHMITDAVSAALVQEVARRAGDKLQHFQIRNDSRSGGTIGPFVSSRLGLRGVDIGIAQLSMHSIRATIGSKDVWLGVRFFKNFFTLWHDVDVEFRLGGL